jgi:hypothetical protein
MLGAPECRLGIERVLLAGRDMALACPVCIKFSALVMFLCDVDWKSIAVEFGSPTYIILEVSDRLSRLEVVS